MDTNQVSLGGALLVMVVSLVYLILFLIVQFKLFSRRGNQSKEFCDQAEREGRMVTAHLDSDRRVFNSKEDRWEYIGRYTYTAPDGKQYKMKAWDCQRFLSTPPETITLYLESRNYHKYYIKGYMQMGKHGAFFFLLSWVIGIVIYFNLIGHFIMPFVMR